MLTIIIILLCLFAIYVFCMNGRKGQSQLETLRGWYYAHRGLHGEGIPENSMAAFREAKEAGYGIELDVHLMKDGNLAVIHDSSLVRTASVDVKIEDLTAEQLKQYRLEGTQEEIPLFSQVLELFDGEAPLIIELKSADKNHAALCRKTCEMLDSYKGAFCIESFDPYCVNWLRKNRPDIIRGQLSSNFLKTKSNLPWILKFAASYQFFNVAVRPDFIAYHFHYRKTLSNWIIRKLWGIQGVAWTLKTKEDFDVALREGWIPIFEDFRP